MTPLTPALDSCYLHLAKKGKPLLEMTMKEQKITHELTAGEMNIFTKVLGNSEMAETNKQHYVASLVSTIVASQQISMNYNGDIEKNQQRSEGLQI